MSQAGPRMSSNFGTKPWQAPNIFHILKNSNFFGPSRCINSKGFDLFQKKKISYNNCEVKFIGPNHLV